MLANVFVGYCESLVPDAVWPSLYCHFVNDCFACLVDDQQSEQLLQFLHGIHSSLQFTCEHESDGRLLFMDVLVEKTDADKVVTSVYHKPTFTGLYIPWDSFCAGKHKINFVKSLVHRAMKICSKSRLGQEIQTRPGTGQVEIFV